MDKYQSLKFASLLHDIGKFYQRADNYLNPNYASKYRECDYGRNGAHSKWSADFVSTFYNDLVENLVLYHHNPKKDNSIDYDLAKIVQISDRHSSKERIDSDEKSDARITPLISIFSKVKLDAKENEDYYVPLEKLDFKKNLFPDKDLSNWNVSDRYKKLWSEFKEEFLLIPNKDFETTLAVVKKYTSTVPSAPYYSTNDISLYDHLKTTTAIANCRYLYSKENKLKNNNDEQKVYKIINGDISGIQNFIYRIHSPEKAQNRMSKRLRGRALYLSLLSESIANKIILDLNLDSSNILFCGGGRFTIIAPNTKKTAEVIKNIDYEINLFFINQFNAELYLAMVSVEACGKNLENFDVALSKINSLLNENKQHKFVNHLEKIFEIEDKVNYEICPVCGNNTSEKNKICSECNNHEKLGGKVANSKYMIKYINNSQLPNSDFFIDFLNIGFIFTNKLKDATDIVNENKEIKFTVYTLNDTNFLNFAGDVTNDNVSFDFKPLGNSIPIYENQPLYFNHLAEISKGADKLGVLKMDVDNLGKIFSQGFKHLNNGKDGASISRISSLSFYMDLFFSGFINNITDEFKVFTQNFDNKKFFDEIEIKFEEKVTKKVYRFNDKAPDEFKEKYSEFGSSTIHINYSGGDDLLVVGPYDDIIEFANKFRKNFKNWTTNNDSINISGGISLVSPKFPIGKAALLADRELEKSKDCGRDKITVFGEILSWKSKKGEYKGFDDLFEFATKLEELYSCDKISKGFIYSLLKIWQTKSNVNEISNYNSKSWQDNNVERLSKKGYVPVFLYKLRTVEDKEIRHDLTDKMGLIPWIKMPVSWAGLRLR